MSLECHYCHASLDDVELVAVYLGPQITDDFSYACEAHKALCLYGNHTVGYSYWIQGENQCCPLCLEAEDLDISVIEADFVVRLSMLSSNKMNVHQAFEHYQDNYTPEFLAAHPSLCLVDTSEQAIATTITLVPSDPLNWPVDQDVPLETIPDYDMEVERTCRHLIPSQLQDKTKQATAPSTYRFTLLPPDTVCQHPAMRDEETNLHKPCAFVGSYPSCPFYAGVATELIAVFEGQASDIGPTQALSIDSTPVSDDPNQTLYAGIVKQRRGHGLNYHAIVRNTSPIVLEEIDLTNLEFSQASTPDVLIDELIFLGYHRVDTTHKSFYALIPQG